MRIQREVVAFICSMILAVVLTDESACCPSWRTGHDTTVHKMAKSAAARCTCPARCAYLWSRQAYLSEGIVPATEWSAILILASFSSLTIEARPVLVEYARPLDWSEKVSDISRHTPRARIYSQKRGYSHRPRTLVVRSHIYEERDGWWEVTPAQAKLLVTIRGWDYANDPFVAVHGAFRRPESRHQCPDQPYWAS